MKNILRIVFALLFASALTPVMAKEEAQKAPEKPAENVMKIIKSRSELSKFAGMIDEADLDGTLEAKDGTYTVFAPTNDALGKVPSDVMKRAKADKAHFKSFVGYHVISGSKVMFGNIQGRRAGPAAMSGETIAFEGTGKVVKVNNAEFKTTDLAANNGVVHIIDSALIPSSLKDQPVKTPEIMPEMIKPAPIKAPEAKAPEKKEKEKEKTTDQKPATTTESPAAAPPAPAATPAVTTPEPEKTEKKSWFKKLLGK